MTTCEVCGAFLAQPDDVEIHQQWHDLIASELLRARSACYCPDAPTA